MIRRIPVERDTFIGTGYWQYRVTVEIVKGEIIDSTLMWAKGSGPDDDSLEITELVEDRLKECAEHYIHMEVGDVLKYDQYKDRENSLPTPLEGR